MERAGAAYRRALLRAKRKIKPAFWRDSLGLTLLEILLALAVFSFILVFLSRITRYSSKQKEKLSFNIKARNIENNTLDLMRRDFQGVLSFFDFNLVLQGVFPVKEPGREEDNQPLGALKEQAPLLRDIAESGIRGFDFIGKPSQMEFPSFTLVSSFQAKARFQLAWIRYGLEDCKPLDRGPPSKCLVRELRDKKDPFGAEEPKERQPLLEGIKSLAFSYYNSTSNDWQDEWEDKDRMLNSEAAPFPRFVKAEIEWEESEKREGSVYQFPVSQHLSGSANQNMIMAGIIGRYKAREEQKRQKARRGGGEKDRSRGETSRERGSSPGSPPGQIPIIRSPIIRSQGQGKQSPPSP